MKVLLLGWYRFDFKGNDGGQVVGRKLDIAIAGERNYYGLSTSKVGVNEDVQLPDSGFPCYAEVEFTPRGKVAAVVVESKK